MSKCFTILVYYSLIEDRAERYERMYKTRNALEDDWKVAAKIKRDQDVDERMHGRLAGQLLHEQCDRYKRCHQCKRTTHNCGESHILRQSQYIPGSRLMV